MASTTIFVSGLPQHVVGTGFKQQLRKAFEPFGGRRIRVEKDHDGHTRGWAFVTVASAADVVTAVSILNGHLMLQVGEDKTCSLQVSPSLGKLDTTFPDELYSIRQQIHLDQEAWFSITDQHTAQHMTTVISTIYETAGGIVSQCVITDATACVGGNTSAFARRFQSVHAVEINDKRVEMLEHNLKVLGVTSNVVIHHGDYTNALYHSLQQDIIFIDPPFGGTEYTKAEVIADLFLGEKSISDLVCDQLTDLCDMIAIKLPFKFDVTTLAARLVSKPLPERSFPFTFEFGRTLLFVVAIVPSRVNSKVVFANRTLDTIIASLNSWNNTNAQAHHPRFFDWEKQRWISLGRWKGCKLS